MYTNQGSLIEKDALPNVSYGVTIICYDERINPFLSYVKAASFLEMHFPHMSFYFMLSCHLAIPVSC